LAPTIGPAALFRTPRRRGGPLVTTGKREEQREEPSRRPAR
jgi:hypothetical protein